MAKWREKSDEDYTLPSIDEEFKVPSEETNIYDKFINLIDIHRIKNIFIIILIWIFIIENLYLLITYTKQKEFIYQIYIAIKDFSFSNLFF